MFSEFFDYQTLNDEYISQNAWEEAKVVDGPGNDKETFHYRIDILRYVQFSYTSCIT